MDILLIGGGIFLGAAIVDAAVVRGHRLAVFNRGRSRNVWPAGVEHIVGDRQADLGRLAGRRFDAVIDTCGYVPAEVEASSAALEGSGCYCFISSISAYASMAHAPVFESDALASAEGIDRSDRDLRHYGAQKAACEAEAMRVFGARALVVRPGLIVGPGDRTGRFSYWPWRAMRGGTMLVPDAPADAPLQFIDVRDLGGWIVRLLESGGRGVFNATGPAGTATITWPRLIEACCVEAEGRGEAPVHVQASSEALLLGEGVAPWSELPLWLPSSDAEVRGHSRIDISRAIGAGLVTRPLAETIAAVVDEGVPAADDPRRHGKLTPQREAAVLEAIALAGEASA